MITPEKYKEIFNLFVGDDEYREYFNTPFKNKGYNAATDASILIYIPTSEIDLGFEEINKCNLEDVIPKEIVFRHKIKTKDLERQLLPNLVDEEVIVGREKCEDCDGYGEVDYYYESSLGKTYSQSFDCPICNGHKERLRMKTGKKIPDKYKLFSINDCTFQYQYLKKLIKAANMVNCDEILFSHPIRLSVSFKVNELNIIICQNTSKENITKIKL